MRSTDHTFLAERAVTGLLRLSIRLLCREEVACQVSASYLVISTPWFIRLTCLQVIVIMLLTYHCFTSGAAVSPSAAADETYSTTVDVSSISLWSTSFIRD